MCDFQRKDARSIHIPEDYAVAEYRNAPLIGIVRKLPEYSSGIARK